MKVAVLGLGEAGSLYSSGFLAKGWEVIGFLAWVLENQPELLVRLRERPELWEKLHRMIAECAEERFAKYMIRQAESYRKLMEWHEATRPQ